MMQSEFEHLLNLPGTPEEWEWIEERLAALSVRENRVFTAVTMAYPMQCAEAVVHMLHSLDDFSVCFPAGSYEQLGRFYQEHQLNMPDSVLPYVDMEQLGQQYEDKYPGLFVDNCYIIYPEKSIDPVQQEKERFLLEDSDWSVKLKLASPAVPEGVWLRLPDVSGLAFDQAVETALVRDALQVQRLDDCTLLEAQSILPEVRNLKEQYSSIEELIRDGDNLGYVMGEQAQGEPHWMERFAAALEYEDCRTLKFALDIAQNLHCYEWISCEGLADFAANHLRSEGVSEDIIQSGCIDLDAYAEDLLETSGYMQTSGEGGYIIRNSREFIYEYTTPEGAEMTMQ